MKRTQTFLAILLVVLAVSALLPVISSAECAHTYSWITTKEPTCSSYGTQKGTCTKCGATAVRQISYGDHNCNEPTCEKPGVCKTCGRTIKPKLGHSYGAPTCYSRGTCSRCGQENPHGSYTSHKFTTGSCVNTKKCYVCGYDTGKYGGHSMQPATCTKPSTCSLCGTTSGSTAPHQFQNGRCIVCGRRDDLINSLPDDDM